MEFTGTPRARRPSTRLSTSVSTRSLAGVPVPCALTKSTALRGHAGLGERRAHGELEPAPLRVRRRDVGAVRRAGVAEEVAERPVAAAGRRVVALEHDEAGPLAEEQPAPAPVEGAHGVARQRAQDVEATLDEAAEHVGAPGQDHVDPAGPEEVGAEPEAGGARRARGGHGQDRPPRPQPARQVARRAVVDGARERAEPAAARPGRGPPRRSRRARCRRPRRSARARASAPGAGGLQGLPGRVDQEARGAAARQAPRQAVTAGEGARRIPPELLDLPAPRHAQVADREASISLMPDTPVTSPAQKPSRSWPMAVTTPAP